MTNRAEPSGADALFGEEMTCPRRTVQGDPIFLLLVRSCSSTEPKENIFQRIAIIMILGVFLVSFSAGHAVGGGRSDLQRSLPNLLVAFGADRGESAGTTWRERSLLCSAKNVCGA